MENGKWKMENIFLVLVVFAFALPVFGQNKTVNMRTKSSTNVQKTDDRNVFQPSKSPIVSFRIQFITGAIDDPKGKEGLANLTAAMLANGGSKKLTYDEIVEKFYPMAAGFGYQVDKEMTTFIGATHSDNLDKYYDLISQMLLDPGFREDDFTRIKQDVINALKVGLRQSNDEELGKERLYNIIYKNHPYEHYTLGTISSLEKMTLQDVRDFYAKNYSQTATVLGLSGGFDTKFSNKITTDFAKLPKGTKTLRKISAPTLEDGMKIDIVQRETRATAISMGFPIDVNRADKDFAALALVASYFGQHRSSNSYLYGQLREKRGLNYGDYAYIEYFPRGMFQFEPDPNLARQQQIFQIWIRPVEPNNANFALRATLYEFDKLVKNGMTKQTFEETRDFLTKYVNILTQTKDAELGYALDSKFYGIANYNEYMKAQLSKLTLADVNNAIKKHLLTDKMRVVMITKDAEVLREEIVKNKPAFITYAASKPQEILSEDAIIANYPIKVKSENVTITPVEKIFQ